MRYDWCILRTWLMFVEWMRIQVLPWEHHCFEQTQLWCSESSQNIQSEREETNIAASKILRCWVWSWKWARGGGGFIPEGSLDGLGVKVDRKAFQVFRWGWEERVGLGKREGPWPEGWVEWREKFIPEEELALENLWRRRGVRVWLVKAKQVYSD